MRSSLISFRARLAASMLAASYLMLITGSAHAVSDWNPTLLVNTTSHQTIDEGTGSTDVELRFGPSLNETLKFNRTRSRFEFSDDLSVLGTLSGTTLRIDGNAGIGGNLSASGTLKIGGLLNCNTIDTDANGNLTCGTDANSGISQTDGDARYVNQSGDTMTGALRISNGAGLNASGAILTNGNATLNSDNGAADAVLTFGNATLAQSLTYSHTNQRFEFSKDVKVTGNIRASGNLSGATLTVDGGLTLRGINYTAPSAQGATNTYLKNDGAGGLSWATTSVGNGSGGALSLHPQYPNAVYAQSGSTAVGMLTQGADATNKELFYRWVGDDGANIQDYWIWARVKVPKNFNNWTPTPIQFRYRTLSTSAAVNHLTVRLLDTTGANVAITGGAALASGSADTWTTASIGNVSGGTYTPDGFITILTKVASTSAGHADAGYLNINWSTTTP